MGRGREAILMQWHYFLHNTQRDKNNKNHSKPTKKTNSTILMVCLKGNSAWGILGVMTILMGWNMIGHMISGFGGTGYPHHPTIPGSVWLRQFEQINNEVMMKTLPTNQYIKLQALRFGPASQFWLQTWSCTAWPSLTIHWLPPPSSRVELLDAPQRGTAVAAGTVPRRAPFFWGQQKRSGGFQEPMKARSQFQVNACLFCCWCFVGHIAKFWPVKSVF